MRYFLVILFFIWSSTTSAQTYSLQNVDSKVGFKIKNFGSSVDGTFSGLKGTIIFNPDSLSGARYSATIDATTIDTGINLRDKHLRKEDYFDVENYPIIRFESTRVETKQGNEGTITGQLTIKETTKEVTILFKYDPENSGFRLTGEFDLNRRDYDVGGSSFSLADELIVQLDVLATQNN